MATEITSDAMREMSIVTTEDEDGIPETSIDDASIASTGNQPAEISLEDKKIVNYSNDNNLLGALAISGCSGVTSANLLNKTKRKHRRGKPKAKNIKPYKKNWKFPMPSRYRTTSASGVIGNNNNNNRSARIKLARSRSLVPYNTNKFLMEEHLAEVPNALLTPGRTRESSFSVDSEDNYFHSLPEDEEEFLTKEFANVYEKARVERLESLTKQQLIEECLQIEDRYSAQNMGNQKQQQIRIQKISAEFLSKIRSLEEKMRDINRENAELRKKLNLLPNGTEAMSSSSEDSESDSSSSSSNSSCSSGEYSPRHYDENDESNALRMDADENLDENELRQINGNSFHLWPNGQVNQMDLNIAASENLELAYSQMNGNSMCNGHHNNSDSNSSSPEQQIQQEPQPQLPQVDPN